MSMKKKTTRTRTVRAVKAPAKQHAPTNQKAATYGTSASRDKAMSDPVDFYDLDEELTRLRSAIVLLVNCCGAHIIDQNSGRRLMELLKPRYER